MMFSVNEAKLAEIKSYDGSVVGVRVTPECLEIRLIGVVSVANYKAFARLGDSGGSSFIKSEKKLRIPTISKDLFKRVEKRFYNDKNEIVSEEWGGPHWLDSFWTDLRKSRAG